MLVTIASLGNLIEGEYLIHKTKSRSETTLTFLVRSKTLVKRRMIIENSLNIVLVKLFNGGLQEDRGCFS